MEYREILETPYFKALYGKESDLIKIIWLSESENGNVAEFIELNERVLRGMKATRFLSDLREFKFSIIPQSQLDIVKYSSKNMIEAGVRKLALLMPQDIFALVSVEQTVQEAEDVVNFEIQLFDDYDLAMIWLLA